MKNIMKENQDSFNSFNLVRGLREEVYNNEILINYFLEFGEFFCNKIVLDEKIRKIVVSKHYNEYIYLLLLGREISIEKLIINSTLNNNKEGNSNEINQIRNIINEYNNQLKSQVSCLINEEKELV